MKSILALLFFAAISGSALAADTPAPVPSPAPEPTLHFPDGHDYTVGQILQVEGMLQQRVNEVTAERNNLAGQVIDLSAQIQRLQQQQQQQPPPAAPAPTVAPPSPVPSTTPELVTPPTPLPPPK